MFSQVVLEFKAVEAVAIDKVGNITLLIYRTTKKYKIKKDRKVRYKCYSWVLIAFFFFS